MEGKKNGTVRDQNSATADILTQKLLDPNRGPSQTKFQGLEAAELGGTAT